MSDRDTFAAAALTGLLAAPTDKDRSMDYWARLSYEAADAMLRERERTNHDAAPAARAQNPTTGSCPAREGCCTGNAKVGVPDTGSGAGSTPVAQQPSRGIRAGLCQPFDSAPTTLDAQPGAKAEPSERGTRREGQGTGDICERLRGWFKAVDAVPATDLMDEAADEIERLRLTDFEKEAIAQGASCISRLLPHWGHPMSLRAAALRALLERLE